MNFITDNLGDNKINIQISSNKFEETNDYVEEENLFDSIENIYDIYCKNEISRITLRDDKSNKIITSPIVSNNDKSNKIIAAPIVSNNDKSNKIIVSNNDTFKFSEMDSLILCILEIIDPCVSLLSNVSKYDNIDNFKKMMQLNLDLIKLSISKDVMKTALEKSDIKICIYLSKLLKKSIVIKKDNDIEIYGDIDDCIYIEYDEINKMYSISKLYSTGHISFFTELMINERIKYMLENNIIEKLNTLLVKELRDIADKLKITTYKIEDNKKKFYLKNELKDIIKKKLENL